MHKIGKNIIFLYIRLVFTMCLSLYTSRLLLINLGVESFGIYNLVGGIVVMMAFLNSAMASSTQRFLSFELGNDANFSRVLRNSKTLHYIIGGIVFVLAEIIGLYLINNYLNFGSVNIYVVNIIYQLSLLSFIINVVNVPYMSVVMAKQDMGFYAALGIVEGLLKFLAAYILVYLTDERLIYYSVFILFVTFILALTSRVFIIKKYKNLVSGKLLYDKSLMKEMAAFAGWNMIGVFAGIGYNNGVNILLNMFFGITVNAARAIVFQIQNAINTVVTNLQIAFNPNIIEKYAKNDKKEYLNFIFISTKLSFIIIMMMIICLYLNLNEILIFWLKDVPENTDLYLKIVLIDVIIGALVGPLHTLIQASGKVKIYQIIVSGILLLNLPISYFLIKANYNAEITFMVALWLNLLSYFIRLFLLNRLVQFNAWIYLKKIVIPVIICLVILVISKMILINNSNLLLTFYMLVIFTISASVLFFNSKDFKSILSVVKNVKK